MPITSVPNLLTLSRILVIPVVIATFYVSGDYARWFACALFSAAGVTDWLDGHMARRWEQQSEIGRFLDPIADKLLVSATLFMLTTFGRLSAQAVLPALVILCREILVSGLREYLAGLRVGAIIADPDVVERLAAAPPNNLGSSLLSQRAALAGLSIKDAWFPGVLAQTRENQALIHEAVGKITGLSMPVYPSNGNFIVIECGDNGVRPEALVAAYGERGFMIRQGSYHTPTFGDRFVKVSTSVPKPWIEEFVELLPAIMERARGLNASGPLF